jgi:hypothetical protein
MNLVGSWKKKTRGIMMINPWEEIIVPKSDLSARRIDHTHPLDIFWAKDRFGRFLFLCNLTKDCKLPLKMPSVTGIEILGIAETQQLVLSLKNPSDWELFYSLCTDIISATKSLKKVAVVPVIFRRIERWRAFLKQDRARILPERMIKGLIGELIYLKDHISPKFGMAQAIEFWTGPEGSPQDFNINDVAIEVKCQMGTSAPKINISSAEQLCTQLSRLYLFVVTLGKTEPDSDNSVSLPSLIENIKDELESSGSSQQLEKFTDILLNIGYVQHEDYRMFTYLISSRVFMEVNNDFPKIKLETIPAGLTNVTYDLSLAACEHYIVDESKVTQI